MVIARIRTNARKVTVRVRNGPARTIVTPSARTIRAPMVARRKPTLKERLLRPFRTAGRPKG